MNKYSKFFIPAIYVCVVCVMVIGVMLILSGVKNYLDEEEEKYNYTLDSVFDTDTIPVMKNDDTSLIKPYISDDVKISKYYYDSTETAEKQANSLIFYKDTYIQNDGIDYIEIDDFDVVSIYDGEVISVDDNEIYGKVISVKHNDNLISKYYNVDNILVSQGYKVSKGEIIATSSQSQLDNSTNSLLHFEIYYKNECINPENIYELSIDNFK